MTTKTYFFSSRKHAHDIEFRKNRTFNEMHNLELSDTKLTETELDTLCQLHDLYEALTDLLLAVLSTQDQRGVARLTGKQLGLAKETVLWAESTRADTQLRTEA